MSKPRTEPTPGIRKNGWTELPMSYEHYHTIESLAAYNKCTKGAILARALSLYEIVHNASIREDVMITVCRGQIKGIRGSDATGDSPKERGAERP